MTKVKPNSFNVKIKDSRAAKNLDQISRMTYRNQLKAYGGTKVKVRKCILTAKLLMAENSWINSKITRKLKSSIHLFFS